MSESLGVAVLDLTVDDSGLEQGLSNAESKTEGAWGKIGGAAVTGAKVIGAAVVATGAAFVTGAFKTAAYGDEVAKTAPKLGISTQALQEYRVWADRNGISTSTMERAVGRLNQRLGDGEPEGNKYVQAMNDIGVATLDTEGNVRGAEEVFVDTIQALSDIEDPSLKAAAAAEIFGTKTARELMPALQDGSLTLEEATVLAEELGIVMDEDALAAAERFTDGWQNLKDAGMGFLRQFGAPVMEFMADKLFPIIQDKVIPVIKEFGEWIGPKLKAAAETVSQFFEEKVLPVFEKLSAWWETHGPTIKEKAQEFFDYLEENARPIMAALGMIVIPALTVALFKMAAAVIAATWPFVAVGAAIAAFVALVVWAYNNVEWFRNFIDYVWENIGKIISTAIEFVRKVITKTVTAIRNFWQKNGERILNNAQRVWDAIRNTIDRVINIIKGIIDVVMGVIRGDWSRAWSGIQSIFSNVWAQIRGVVTTVINVIRSIISGALSAIRGVWSAAWNGLRSVLSSAWSGIRNAVTNGISNVLGLIRSLPRRILSAIGNVGRLLFNVGRDIIRGFINGIKNMFGSVRDTFSGLTNMLPSWKGPKRVDLKLLRGPAEDIMGGFANDLERYANKDVQAAMTSATNIVAGGMTPDGSGNRTTSHFEIGKVEIAAKDLQEMRDISDFFEKVGQTARAGVE